jgi:phosphoribosylanthranilate isomerase
MQPHPLLKICGITNPGDGQRALQVGATALGLNGWPGSKRYVALTDHAAWIRQLNQNAPDGVIVVLVNPDLDAVLQLREEGLATQFQLHGEETPEFVAELMERQVPVIKALRVRGEDDLADLERFACETLLLDAWHPGERGGTGTTFDWQLARQAVRQNPRKRLILSGGLTPLNVGEAIEKVSPGGVDVASGVENAGNPRQKNAKKMADFCDAARVGYQNLV